MEKEQKQRTGHASAASHIRMKMSKGVARVVGFDLRTSTEIKMSMQASDPKLLQKTRALGWASVLRIKVSRAQDLAQKNTVTGKSDPYVVVSLGVREFQTAYISKNLNPVWNEVHECVLSKGDMEGMLVFRVYDYDAILTHQFMGEVQFDMARTKFPFKGWCKLQSRGRPNEEVSGEILLSISVRESEKEEKFSERREAVLSSDLQASLKAPRNRSSSSKFEHVQTVRDKFSVLREHKSLRSQINFDIASKLNVLKAANEGVPLPLASMKGPGSGNVGRGFVRLNQKSDEKSGGNSNLPDVPVAKVDDREAMSRIVGAKQSDVSKLNAELAKIDVAKDVDKTGVDIAKEEEHGKAVGEKDWVSQDDRKTMRSKDDGKNVVSEDGGKNVVSEGDAKNVVSEDDAKNVVSEDDGKNVVSDEDGKNVVSEDDAKNVVSENDGKNVVSEDDGKNVVSEDDAKNVVSEDAGKNVVSDDDGKNVVFEDDAKNVVSEDGKNVVSEDGNNAVSQDGNNVASDEGGENAVSEDGNVVSGEESNAVSEDEKKAEKLLGESERFVGSVSSLSTLSERPPVSPRAELRAANRHLEDSATGFHPTESFVMKIEASDRTLTPSPTVAPALAPVPIVAKDKEEVDDDDTLLPVPGRNPPLPSPSPPKGPSKLLTVSNLSASLSSVFGRKKSVPTGDVQMMELTNAVFGGAAMHSNFRKMMGSSNAFFDGALSRASVDGQGRSELFKRLGMTVTASATLYINGDEVVCAEAIMDPAQKQSNTATENAKLLSDSKVHKAQRKIEDLRHQTLNERFQRALARLDLVKDTHTSNAAETAFAYQELMNIAKDFLHVCQTYGKIIITERFLSLEEKTIKPIDIGGRAGGVKYIVSGVLFKFAIDAQDLFHGSDAAAHKVAGHELRGLMCYFNNMPPGVSFPLMSLIDFKA